MENVQATSNVQATTNAQTMNSVQLMKVGRGDNQLIAAPLQGGAELRCLAGRAVLRNHSQRIHWPLRSGLALKLRPGVVYRLDARTDVELELASPG